MSKKKDNLKDELTDQVKRYSKIFGFIVGVQIFGAPAITGIPAYLLYRHVTKENEDTDKKSKKKSKKKNNKKDK